MPDTGYLFDTADATETERLGCGEALWDPGTRDRLRALGIGPGAACLEIGAGRGGLAYWLAGLVGSTGRVTATDLRTDRLDWLRRHRVEVLAHDIDADEPPVGYDLVHARLVLPHVADRPAAVARMCRALRPGGLLMLEDADGAALFRHPDRDDFCAAVKAAAYEAMTDAGYHPRCGTLDARLAAGAGLADVRAAGRAVLVRGGSTEARWYALWLARLRPAMLARGRVSGADVDRALAELADPGNTWLSQVMVTVTGRVRR
ncbi:MAG TPA: class I SAM-dependent methyltransferase [Actinocatenispora sp.]